MKQQELNQWKLAELNQLLNKQFSKEYWQFLVQQMNYSEIRFDPDIDQIVCPTFIPFQDLVVEVLNELNKRKSEIKPCLVCDQFFDINKEDGIFGDTRELENFICNGCANKISAKSFYERYLVM